jgi:hypothetical protein
MANPVFVTVTKNTPTKVATNVTTGQIRRVKPGTPGAQYLYTYVLTGGAAPVEADFRGGRIFQESDSEIINATAGIDIWLYLDSDEDGEVRVEV